MSKYVSLEWSLFGIRNPLEEQVPIIDQTFTDKYILWTPRATVKVRRRIVKYKVVLDKRDDIEVFNVEQFSNNPDQDPLQSFLRLHSLGERYALAGVILTKQRKIYHLEEGVRLYYMDFTLGSRQDTNLTITGRTKESILEAKARLGLTGSNLNFGAYLTTHVGSSE